MDSTGYPSFYQAYIEKIPNGELIDLFSFSLSESLKSLVMISEEKGNYSYEEGKWSIKTVLQHLIDVERILSYRALAIARGENNNIPGFDHDSYALESKGDHRTVKALLEELKRLRASTIDLFSSMDQDMLSKVGKANGYDFRPEQLGYVIIGHEMHHVSVLEERYL